MSKMKDAMLDYVQELKGWYLLYWYVKHFGMSVTTALDDMREHNQNMDFLSDADAQDKLNRLTLLYLLQKQFLH